MVSPRTRPRTVIASCPGSSTMRAGPFWLKRSWAQKRVRPKTSTKRSFFSQKAPPIPARAAAAEVKRKSTAWNTGLGKAKTRRLKQKSATSFATGFAR